MTSTIGANDQVALQVNIGQTLSFTVTRQNFDGTAKDVTGGTYTAKIRPTYESSTVIATLVCTIASPSSAGLVGCVLSATASGSLTDYVGTRGVWDIREQSGGTLQILTGGPVTFRQVATR